MHTEPERTTPADDAESTGRHHAKDGADLHPLIDLDRDPTPGKPDHAAEEED